MSFNENGARERLVPYDDDAPWYHRCGDCLSKCKNFQVCLAVKKCFWDPMKKILSGSILPYLSWAVILITIFLILIITKGVHEIQKQRGKDSTSLLSVNLKIVLTVFMFFSIICIIYCFCRRLNRNTFVRYKKLSSKSIPIRYLLVGLYVFGIGTIFVNMIWLLYFIHAREDHKNISKINELNESIIDLIYSACRLLFVVLQIAFLQTFWSATFNTRWEVTFLLFHTMAVNMCVWLMNVADETHVFESQMKTILAANSTKDSFEDLMKTYDSSLTPFTLEYSLIVSGILYGIIREMKDFSVDDDEDEFDVEVGDDDETNTYVSLGENKGRYGVRQGSQPGMIVGILFATFLLVSKTAIGFEDIDEYHSYLCIFYIFSLTIFISMAFSSWRIMVALQIYEKVKSAKIRPDDILLVFSLIWGIAFDAIVIFGTSKCTMFSSDLVNLMIAVEVLQFLQRVFQTWILVLSHTYDPKIEEEDEMAKAKIIRQHSLFLLITNLGMWALDTFFEMNNFGAASYPCGPNAFGNDWWDKLMTFTYPVIIF